MDDLSHTDSGRSALTLYGFGGNRYTDPFDSHFDAEPDSITQTIVFPSKPSKKKVKDTDSALACESSLETDTRKMRLGGPENQQLVLQYLGSSGDSFTQVKADPDNNLSSGSPSLDKHDRFGGISRSHQQPSPSDETSSKPGDKLLSSHTDHFLQMIWSGNTGPAGSQVNNQRVDTSSIPTQPSPSSQKSSSPTKLLKRQGSSPNLLPSSRLNNTPNNSTVADAPESNKGQLKHSASHSGLSSLVSLDEHFDESPQMLIRRNTVTALSSRKKQVAVPESSAVASASAAATNSDVISAGSSVDASDSVGKSGLGVLARTRKFGAWLGQITQGQPLEVTQKDLNVFAPTSF